MGVLAPGSALATPSAWPPIDMSENLLAHIPLQNCIVWGEGESPN